MESLRNLKAGANKLIYLPVISGPGGYMSSKRTHRSLNGKNLGWWMKNSVYEYNGILMSAYYGLETGATREALQIRDDVVFFGDSGGFQIYNLGWDDPKRREELKSFLTPEKVITWQQENCDIGMTLDLPLPDFHAYDRQMFEEHLAISKANGDKMMEMKTKKDFQLFGVVHGRDLHDLHEWWETSTLDFEYDGYSLDAGDIRTVTMDLGFAIEYLEGKPFHILGASGFQSVLLMAYANQYMKTALYYDSSTYNTGNTLRKYINHYDVSGSGLLLNSKEPISLRSSSRLDKITCPCPTCQQLEKPSDLWEKGTASGTYISLHNLFWFNNFSETLEQLIKNPEYWEEFCRRFARPKTRKYMKFIDDVVDIGIEKAWSKHFEKASGKLEDWY